MAQILAIMDIMPEDLSVDLNKLKTEIKKIIEKMKAKFGEVKEEEIAFGLKKLKFVIISDEKQDLNPLEEKIREVKGVKSAEIVDMRRAIG